jgi:hypothetical protein
MTKLPLSELILAVTSELHKAEMQAREAYGDDEVMEFDECELDLAVEVEMDAKAEVKVYVFKLGGGAKKTDKNSIKVKFKKIKGRSMTFPMQQEGPGPKLG